MNHVSYKTLFPIFFGLVVSFVHVLVTFWCTATFNTALFQQQLSVMQVRPASKSLAKFAKLEVFNIPKNVTELEVRTLFSKYGNVVETRMLMGKELSYFACHAYVLFETPEEASKAIQELDGTLVNFKPRKPLTTEDQQMLPNQMFEQQVDSGVNANVPLIVRFATISANNDKKGRKKKQKKKKQQTKKRRRGGRRGGRRGWCGRWRGRWRGHGWGWG